MRKIIRSRDVACLLWVLAVLLCGHRIALASTETWTGNGASSAWSVNGNWSGIGGAGANDDLIFPNLGHQELSNNDFAVNTNFSSLTFTGFGYTITGNQIFLGSGGTAGGIDGSIPQAAPAFTFAPNIILGKSQTFSSTGAHPYTLQGVVNLNTHDLTLAGGGDLVLNGTINGTGTLTKNGAGTATLNGTSTGFGMTSIVVGTLRVNGAIGNVTLQSGTLSGSGTIGSLGIPGLSAKTIAPGGSSTTGILHTGAITGMGTPTTLAIRLNGTVAGSGHDQLAATTIGNFGGATLSLSLGFAPAVGDQFVIITKTAGTIGLFAQGTSITAGGVPFSIAYNTNSVVLTALASTRTWSGLGANANWSTPDNWVGGVAPLVGDSLVFPDGASKKTNTNNYPAGSRFKSIALNGSGYLIGGSAITLDNGISENAPAGVTTQLQMPITLSQPQTFSTNSQGFTLAGTLNLGGSALTISGHVGTLTIAGAISGAGGITKTDTNSATFHGNNTYTGVTQIDVGTLSIAHGNGLGASGAGNHTTVASGATLRIAANGINTPEAITLNGHGVGGLGALRSSNCAGCTVAGAVTLASNISIGTGPGDRLTISSVVGESGGAQGLTTTGTGTLVLANANAYSGGTLITGGSTLLVNGSVIGTVFIFTSGGTLGGTGTVGGINSQSGGSPGIVAPGASAGTLTVSGNVDFVPQTTFSIEIGGTTAGTQHDRLNATGTVSLGGATLQGSLLNGFTPAIGDQFTIIQSSGARSGQFAHGNGTITIGGTNFATTYSANSVVLTALTSLRTWSGASVTDSNWTTGPNWAGGVAPVPGDSLAFPDGAARKTNANDFPALTLFNSIALDGGGYVLGGNAITLSGGIAENAVGVAARPQLNLGIRLSQPQTFAANNKGLIINGAVNLNGSGLTMGTSSIPASALIFGQLSGAGGLTKTGIGALALGADNVYTGITQVNAGTLVIFHNNALGAAGVGNQTVVADGASVRIEADGLVTPESFTLNGTGAAGVGAIFVSDCASGCTVSGPVTLGSNSTITAQTKFDKLTIGGAVGDAGGAKALTVMGPGTFVLANSNTHTGGTTIAQGAILFVNGTTGAVAIAATGGILGGTGTVGAITGQGGGSAGTVAPGASAGILNAVGNVTFAAQTIFSVEIGGTTVGTQHDQLNVKGTINLGGAILEGTLFNGFVPAVGNQFTIIQSTGPISGQFAQGASITFSGVLFNILYSTNSVVLAVAGGALPDLTVTKTHTGSFAPGQTGATYTVTVTNSGAGDKPAATPVTLLDTPSAGLAVTAMSGTGWTCTVLPSCTRSDLLAGFQSYPPLTITVTVAGNATSPQTNTVTVSTLATESNAGNNTASDVTSVVAPPDLTITKSHSGNFSLGQIGAAYTVTVSNSGTGDKPAANLVTVTENPPSGLTITAMNGAGWTCAALPVCTRTDALAAGQSYPALAVTVNVAANATSPQVNNVTVTTTAAESNGANNAANDSTNIVLPDLVVAKSHSGNFSLGQVGAAYAVTVSNAGAGDKLAATLVTVTDTPPAGLTVTGMSGSGWTCTTLPACTRADALASGQSYPPITVTVNVAANATSPQINSVTVTRAATESNPANNTATDSTNIVLPDLIVTKVHSGNFTQGQLGATYTVTVSNTGAGDKLAGADVSVTDTAPAGLTIAAMSGTGWTCTTLPACTRADALAAGQSYPALTVTVDVAADAASPRVNSVTVTTTAVESNAANNTGTDSTTIVSLPDLIVTKTHAGNFSLGQVGAVYTVTVANNGAGSKPAAAAVTLTDTPPPGLTITAMSGTGWTCTTLPACSRTDALAAGQAYPPVTVMVDVAPDALSPLVNSVAVSTVATESNAGNNVANDPTTILLPNLNVTKTHAGNFALGQIGAVYTVTVSNTGSGDKPAGSLVSLVDTPPAGLTVTGMSGTGWTCAVLPTCTRTDVLAAGQSYPPLTIAVDVAANATSPRVNSVTVSTTATESNVANNTAEDSTTIGAGVALTVNKFGSGTGTVTSQDGGIACGATCTHTYADGTNVTLAAVAAGNSVFTGWQGPCTGSGACLLTIGGAATVSATFALSSIGTHTLDIDANSQFDALTDGLMVVRHLLGLAGTAVTAGATGPNANRLDPTQIGNYLVDILPLLDVDGNGGTDALTDGLLIIRYLFGLRGPGLTDGAVGSGATRDGPQIQTYIQSLMQ